MIRIGLLIALLILTIAMACDIKDISAPKTAISPEIQSPKALKEAWEDDWEMTIKAAKKEGKLVIYVGGNPELREAWKKGYEEKFGIPVEYVVAQSLQLVAKVLAEYRANLFLGDIPMVGASTGVISLKPAGVLASLDPILILPEVLDPKVWYGGKLPFADKGHTVMRGASAPATGFIINANLVKPGEINSYQDLLNPQWKGKIILADPTMPPGGDIWFNAYVHGGLLSLDYMKALARQEPFISRDRRQAAEWLAREKYAVSLATGQANFQEFIDVGMPVKTIRPLEGDYLTAAVGTVSVFNRAPHPNAAKLFVNWFLSKDGATIHSRAHNRQSARLDVPTEGLIQDNLRQPDVKYIHADDEEMIFKMPEARKMALEIFGPLIK